MTNYYLAQVKWYVCISIEMDPIYLRITCSRHLTNVQLVKILHPNPASVGYPRTWDNFNGLDIPLFLSFSLHISPLTFSFYLNLSFSKFLSSFLCHLTWVGNVSWNTAKIPSSEVIIMMMTMIVIIRGVHILSTSDMLVTSFLRFFSRATFKHVSNTVIYSLQ